MKNLPDIDIDTTSTFDPSSVFNATRASMVAKDKLVPHPCGYYFDNIPVDKVTGLSAIPYKAADKLGYFKVDMLHNTVYDRFNSRYEIEELIKIEPNWDLLEHSENIVRLTQIHDHAAIVLHVKPRSINMLADVLALIRPGKRHLLVPYTLGRIDQKTLYTSEDGQYTFKKAHAIAYAHVIVLEMHLLEANLL